MCMIMKTYLTFHELAERVLDDLAQGLSVAITGLSNSGKSDLMRGLARSEVQSEYAERLGRPVALIYVDCNRAVAITAQAFYEVVLRSILEWLDQVESTDLAATLRVRYQSITEAENAFTASLSFNLALSELCEGMDTIAVLFFDEFDEVYEALDERALLNLRALHDRFTERLRYVTATVRRLREIPAASASVRPARRRASRDAGGSRPDLCLARSGLERRSAVDRQPKAASQRRVSQDLGATHVGGAGRTGVLGCGGGGGPAPAADAPS